MKKIYSSYCIMPYISDDNRKVNVFYPESDPTWTPEVLKALGRYNSCRWIPVDENGVHHHEWGDWVITQAQLLKEGGTKRHYTWTGFLDMIDHRHPVVRPKAFYVYSWCLIPRLYLPIISNSCYLQAFPESFITICYPIVSLSLLCPCLHNDLLFGKILVYSGVAYNPAKEFLVSLLCLYLQSGHFLSAIDSHATHATIAIMNHRLCGIFSTVFAK